MKKIVIIGGGFGGLNAALKLKKLEVEVLLIDQTNHHLFQPLLYQVATAALSLSDIASPIREILRKQKNCRVIMATVEHVDRQKKEIYLQNQETHTYDYLIMAPGSFPFYFNKKEWEKYAHGLKTVNDALKIKDQLLNAFEMAERSHDVEEQQKWMTFVIIGAGPTGVEMAGSIAEFAHFTLKNNFRNIDPANAKIYLIEGFSQILPAYPEELAKKAEGYLQTLGVIVLKNTRVVDLSKESVSLENSNIESKTIIWAAGNRASPLLKSLDVPLDRQQRVIVEADLSIPSDPSVFVIGDAACFYDDEKKSLPGIAPVAIQQGIHVAKMIKNDIFNKPREPFKYFDKGNIATIGRGRAVGTLRKIALSGFFAWMIWCFVHVFYLISFPLRLLVMIKWIFLYITNRRESRIIIEPEE